MGAVRTRLTESERLNLRHVRETNFKESPTDIILISMLKNSVIIDSIDFHL